MPMVGIARLGGHLGGQLGRDRLRARSGRRPARSSASAVLDQLLRRVRGLALHAETAQLVHRLRREAEIGRTPARPASPGIPWSARVSRTAFQLDHVRAGRHQLRRQLRNACSAFSW